MFIPLNSGGKSLSVVASLNFKRSSNPERPLIHWNAVAAERDISILFSFWVIKLHIGTNFLLEIDNFLI